jgi:hypothetical protein
MLQIKGTNNDLNIIQVYAPTTEADEDIDEFYNQIINVMKYTKRHDINIICGNFNAKIDNERVENIVGDYGLGRRNARGDKLVQFCQEVEMVITNIWFALPPPRLYTWTSPQHDGENIV